MRYTESARLPRTSMATSTDQWLTVWNAWANQHNADASAEMFRLTAAASGMTHRQFLVHSGRVVRWTF